MSATSKDVFQESKAMATQPIRKELLSLKPQSHSDWMQSMKAMRVRWGLDEGRSSAEKRVRRPESWRNGVY
jgi:hypothetical protein